MTTRDTVLGLRSTDTAALLLVALRGDFWPYCCGQAVRLANELPELSRLGAEVVLASVDPPAAQLAMNQRWHLPFRWVSDPDGALLARPLEAWNPDERGGVFHPLVLLVAPDGREVLRQRSRDVADRPQDDAQLLEALQSLGLPEVPQPPPWAPDVEPEPTGSAFRTDAYGAYFRGIRFATLALSTRMQHDADADETRAVMTMASSFLEAWKQRRAAAT